MKLIIDIDEDVYKRTVFYREFKDLNDYVKTIKALENSTPLDDVKAEIEEIAKDYDKFADYRRVRGLWIALEILNNIGKEESQKLADDVGFLNQSLDDAIDCS